VSTRYFIRQRWVWGRSFKFLHRANGPLRVSRDRTTRCATSPLYVRSLQSWCAWWSMVGDPSAQPTVPATTSAWRGSWRTASNEFAAIQTAAASRPRERQTANLSLQAQSCCAPAYRVPPLDVHSRRRSSVGLSVYSLACDVHTATKAPHSNCNESCDRSFVEALDAGFVSSQFAEGPRRNGEEQNADRVRAR
jgi:hypothetical protein